MAQAQAEDPRKLLDWETLEVGERLPSFSYVLTQQMMDAYRQGVMDPEAAFPTISHKVDVNTYHIADKYARRGKNYIVTQAVSVDEDGRLLDRVITHELKQPSEVGKKWQ